MTEISTTMFQQSCVGELTPVIKAIHELRQSQSKVEGLLARVLEQQSKTLSVAAELKGMLEEQTKKSFSLKSSGYEVKDTLMSISTKHNTL